MLAACGLMPVTKSEERSAIGTAAPPTPSEVPHQHIWPDVFPETDIAIPIVPSPQSASLRLYYAKIAEDLKSQGFLKGLHADAQQQGDLARVFKVLAFSSEENANEQPLSRWGGPLQIHMRLGTSVTDKDGFDLAIGLQQLLPKLAQSTGLQVSQHPSANLNIFVVNEGERRNLGPVLQQTVPGIALADVTRITSMTRDEQCLVMAFESRVPHVRDRALVIIREELPRSLKIACLHEEIAQAIGLTNDSDVAFPSIFNDDDEFAKLTKLDRQLLRLLYHPDLKPGMTLKTAAPIIDRITATTLQTGG